MSDFKAPEISMLPVAALAPAKRNARTHSKKQIRLLADAIRRFGFNSPVVVDEDNLIIAGHGRVAAAKLLGMMEIPCIRREAMTPQERQAYALADNEIALKAGWDKSLLALDFQELLDGDLEIEATGFEQAEVDQILWDVSEASSAPAGPEDRYPELPQPGAAVTRKGDLWVLGNHRLICADAKAADVLNELMPGEEPAMIFTDPPYNQKVQGHVGGRGRVKHREFAEASGEMSDEEYVAYLQAAIGPAVRACKDGAIVYICIDGRHIPDVFKAADSCGLEYKTICVWAKTNAGQGAFYRSQTEFVTVWKVGEAPHTNNFGLGEQGRSRTTLWTYAGVNTFKRDRMEELQLHPTVKPTLLVSDAIRDVTARGEIVLDMFGGSGTTMIAAQKTGRKARLVEIDCVYCDVIVRRWEKLTGRAALLEGSTETFEDVSIRRAAENAAWASPPAPVAEGLISRE